MTLPTSGQISLDDLRVEFGGPTTNNRLSLYYAGAGLVPAGTVGVNGPVPSSGQISLSDFYGTSNTFTSVLTVGVRTVSANEQFRGYESVDSLAGQPASGNRSADNVFGATMLAAYTTFDTLNNRTSSFVIRLAGNRAANFFSSVAINLETTNYTLNTDVGNPGTPGVTSFARSDSIDANSNPATVYQWIFASFEAWSSAIPETIVISP